MNRPEIVRAFKMDVPSMFLACFTYGEPYPLPDATSDQ